MNQHSLLIVCLFMSALVCISQTALAHTAEGGEDYAKTSEGTKVIGWVGSEVQVKILLEAGNLGGSELEIGEITFPGNYEGQPHEHGVVEVFYPLSGDFEHWVDGKWHPVPHGSVATVRPGDDVIHRCASSSPCKLLVIWGPGGEIERLEPSVVEPLKPTAQR